MCPFKRVNGSARCQPHTTIPHSRRTIRTARRHPPSIRKGSQIHDPPLVRGEGAGDELHRSGHVRVFVVARRVVRIQIAAIISREEEGTIRFRERQRTNGKGGVNQTMHPSKREVIVPAIVGGGVNVDGAIFSPHGEGVWNGGMECQGHDAGVSATDSRDYFSGSRFGQNVDAFPNRRGGVSDDNAGRSGILASSGTGCQNARFAKYHCPIGTSQCHNNISFLFRIIIPQSGWSYSECRSRSSID
mmetsp:Transcript_14340/g.25651  ORF Transcript_14340/g.25651 Transcript_14340/m.25651 type:complete len:245 (-) Transcript_14340:593-1327(-)